MNELAAAISELMNAKSWSQKDFAGAWHTATKNDESFSTYETKLSKLMKGQPEGLKFVQDPKRLDGLATALGRPVAELRNLLAASEQEVVLVLDPKLSVEVVTFIHARVSTAASPIRIVQLPREDDSKKEKELFREAASQGKNTVLVMADSRLGEFFDGAGLTWSVIRSEQTGFKILALPDLFPPAAAKTKDTDGTVMVVDAELERTCRDNISGRATSQPPSYMGQPGGLGPLIVRVRQADEAYEPVTFRLDHVVRARGVAPQPEHLVSAAIWQGTNKIPENPRVSSYLWLHEGVVRSLDLIVGEGDRSDRGRRTEPPAAAPAWLSQVRSATTFEPIVDAIRAYRDSVNPHRDGSGSEPIDLSAQIDAFEKETGVSLTIEAAVVRKAVGHQENYDPGSTIRYSPEADTRFRQVLDDLLARDFVLRSGDEWLLHELQAIRDARLVHVDGADGHPTCVAHLGGGYLATVYVRRYARESAVAVRKVPALLPVTVLDGGDIRISWERTKAEALAGILKRLPPPPDDDDD